MIETTKLPVPQPLVEGVAPLSRLDQIFARAAAFNIRDLTYDW
jgi:hypothetical protein